MPKPTAYLTMPIAPGRLAGVSDYALDQRGLDFSALTILFKVKNNQRWLFGVLPHSVPIEPACFVFRPSTLLVVASPQISQNLIAVTFHYEVRHHSPLLLCRPRLRNFRTRPLNNFLKSPSGDDIFGVDALVVWFLRLTLGEWPSFYDHQLFPKCLESFYGGFVIRLVHSYWELIVFHCVDRLPNFIDLRKNIGVNRGAEEQKRINSPLNHAFVTWPPIEIAVYHIQRSLNLEVIFDCLFSLVIFFDVAALEYVIDCPRFGDPHKFFREHVAGKFCFLHCYGSRMSFIANDVTFSLWPRCVL
jgi:hypothetical protein